MASETAGERIAEVATADVRLALGGGQLDRLASLLEPGEEALAVALASRGGRWWRELRPRNALMVVATDRRLLFVPIGPLLREVEGPLEYESLPYVELLRVDEKIGRLRSKLTLATSSGQIRLTSMRAKGARRVADAIRRHS